MSVTLERPASENGAQMLHVRDARHLDFERDRDLLLDLFGRAAGPLGDDVDVVVGYIRIGLDRQIVERDGAPDKQQDGRRQDHESVVKRKIDQIPDHLLLHRVLQLKRVGHHLLAGSEAGDNLLLSVRRSCRRRPRPLA